MSIDLKQGRLMVKESKYQNKAAMSKFGFNFLYKIAVKLCKLIIFSVYQHISVNLAVILRAFFYKSESAQHFLRQRSDPHKCIGNVLQQIELTCSFKNEYSVIYIFAQFLPLNLRKRH